MIARKYWCTSRRLILRVCARAGLSVRAHTQVGKSQAECTKCSDGLQVCRLPLSNPQVSVC